MTFKVDQKCKTCGKHYHVGNQHGCPNCFDWKTHFRELAEDYQLKADEYRRKAADEQLIADLRDSY